MAQSEEERPEGADDIVILLQRAEPGAVDRDEVFAESGLTSDKARAAIAFLVEEGEISETKDGSLMSGDGEPEPDQDYETPPTDQLADALARNHAGDEAAAAAAAADSPAGQVRTTLTVTSTFNRAAGESDQAVLQKAQVIADEVGNALGMAFPKLDWRVEVSGVDAFDTRPLWPPPADEGG